MGYIKHHGIAVTSSIDELTKEAHTQAKSIFKERTSEIVNSETNGYKSFFIAPDGSKEGWEESNSVNDQRETFVKWVSEQAHEDGSNSISFCEFFYGEDNGYSQIENHN
tara:strand:- start:745 stop:1071 length:327 start_codon:yes stop_codon:yes gene_type:complete